MNNEENNMDGSTVKIFVRENDSEQIFYFENNEITVGRSSRNDIRLRDQACSRHHCIIRKRGNDLLVEDLRSANNTLVNGEKITSKTLEKEDIIHIGNAELIALLLPASQIQPAKMPAATCKSLEAGKKKSNVNKNALKTDLKKTSRVRYRAKKSKSSFSAIVFSVLALILLATGVKIYNYIQRYSFYQNQYKQALGLEKQEHYDQAISLLEEVEAGMGKNELGAKATRVKRRIEKKAWARRIYARLSRDYQRDKYDTKIYIAKLRGLKTRFPKSGVSRLVDMEIARVESEFLGESMADDANPPKIDLPVPHDYNNGKEPKIGVHTHRETLSGIAALRKLLEKPGIKNPLRKGSWREAAENIEKEREKLDDPEYRLILDAYREDLRGIARLEKLFFQALDSGKLATPPIEISHQKGCIIGREKKRLVVKLANSKGKIKVKWQNLSPSTRLELLRLLPFSGKNSIGLATFGMISSKNADDRDLIHLLRKRPDRKSEVDAFLSRWRGISVPQGGFVIYRQQLVTPEEKILVEFQRKVEKAFSSKKTSAREVGKKLENLSVYCKSQGDKKICGKMKDILAVEMKQQRKKLVERIGKQLKRSAGKIQALKILDTELKKRREYALKLIRDEKKYDKSRSDYQKVQKEVDRRVAAVRESWESSAKVIMKFSPGLMNDKQKLEAIDELLEREFSEIYRDLPKDEKMEFITSFVSERLNIQNYAKRKQERKRILYNQKIFRENAAKKSEATDTERKQVRITNEYRHMMGLTCLKLKDTLTLCARGHSQYMAQHGVFAHRVKGEPAGESPSDRARSSGYSGLVGENIFMGSGDPKCAHDNWLHSAGHHRNILDPSWKFMGAGNYDNHWTQNFGK